MPPSSTSTGISNSTPAGTSNSLLQAIRLFLGNETSVQQTLSFLQVFSPEQVCDAVWFVDEEMAAHQQPNAKRDKLTELVQALAPTHFDTLCSALSLETLERCRIITDVEKTKIVLKRVNTNLKFRQSKFNLVRESNEGFSKLLCELLSADCELDYILALMGDFQLDPNRVMDFCIDLLPENAGRLVPVFVQLISTSTTKLLDLLLFKLNRLGATTTGPGLFDSIALLFTSKLLSAQQLSALLRENEEHHAAQFVALLSMPNGWQHCIEFFSHVAPLSKLLSSAKVLDSLHNMLLRETSSVYALYYTPLAAEASSSSSSPGSNFTMTALDEFVAQILPVLNMLGPQAVANPILLTRFIRLFAKAGLGAKLEPLLGEILLPALSLLPTSNPQVARELWQEFVSALPPKQRFTLYHIWLVTLRNGFVQHPAVIKAKKDCQSSLKRFCLDETKNVFPSMLLNKAANNNPVFAFETILQGIRMQVDVQVIDVIVRALQYTTPLALDVLVFFVCRELSSPNSEYNAASNARLVAQFFAQQHDVDFSPLSQTLLANFSQNRYLLGSLACLEEMVQVSSGLAIVNEYGDTLLRSAAGGKMLKFLSRLSQDEKLKFATLPDASKLQEAKIKHLVEWLGADDMQGKLLRALARCRERAFSSTNASRPFPTQCALYDSCTSSLIQLSDVLKSQQVDLTSSDVTSTREEVFPKEVFWQLARGGTSNSPAQDLFWQVALSDLLFPKKEYEDETEFLRQIKRSSTSTTLMLSLKMEGLEVAKRTQEFAQRLADYHFPERDSFLRDCLIPRLLFSQEDAMVCALFLNQAAAATGREREMLDAVFSPEFLSLVFSVTDRELQCLGIFLAQALAWSAAKPDTAAGSMGYARLVAQVLLDAMKCMSEEMLVAHAFQLTMYLMDRNNGALFPGSTDTAEFFLKTLEEDVLLSPVFLERNNILLQKLRRKVGTTPSETPVPPPLAPPVDAAAAVVTAAESAQKVQVAPISRIKRTAEAQPLPVPQQQQTKPPSPAVVAPAPTSVTAKPSAVPAAEQPQQQPKQPQPQPQQRSTPITAVPPSAVHPPQLARRVEPSVDVKPAVAEPAKPPLPKPVIVAVAPPPSKPVIVAVASPPPTALPLDQSRKRARAAGGGDAEPQQQRSGSGGGAKRNEPQPPPPSSQPPPPPPPPLEQPRADSASSRSHRDRAARGGGGREEEHISRIRGSRSHHDQQQQQQQHYDDTAYSSSSRSGARREEQQQRSSGGRSNSDRYRQDDNPPPPPPPPPPLPLQQASTRGSFQQQQDRREEGGGGSRRDREPARRANRSRQASLTRHTSRGGALPPPPPPPPPLPASTSQQPSGGRTGGNMERNRSSHRHHQAQRGKRYRDEDNDGSKRSKRG